MTVDSYKHDIVMGIVVVAVALIVTIGIYRSAQQPPVPLNCTTGAR